MRVVVLGVAGVIVGFNVLIVKGFVDGYERGRRNACILRGEFWSRVVVVKRKFSIFKNINSKIF